MGQLGRMVEVHQRVCKIRVIVYIVGSIPTAPTTKPTNLRMYMSIRKWGIQRFFNAPDSEDSGFMSAYVKPLNNKEALGFSTNLTIADCSRRISLEFEPYDVYPDRKTGEFSESVIAEAYNFLKARRKKIKVFRDAMNRYCDAIEKAYDEYQKELDKVSIANSED